MYDRHHQSNVENSTTVVVNSNFFNTVYDLNYNLYEDNLTYSSLMFKGTKVNQHSTLLVCNVVIDQQDLINRHDLVLYAR